MFLYCHQLKLTELFQMLLTTNETEDMKEMVMKNQNGGNLNQENIEST
jgi:hypothetical protein